MDFFKPAMKTKKDYQEIFPNFLVKASNDLMVRGGAFYAIWREDLGLWSTNEYDVVELVDRELYQQANIIKNDFNGTVHVLSLRDSISGSWSAYKRILKNLPDSNIQLDTKITFADTPTKKSDYVSRRLPYSMIDAPTPAYEEIISTLYDPEEREKIEWAIGSVIAGDSKDIQKFLVFYGDAGAGKSTILNIIQQLFDGYYTTFDARALATTSNSFSMESFRSNPLVAIQHDGDLSHIEDNTKLNSIVSHEIMTMNEKFKSSYPIRLNCLLFMATNRPVKITDAKSGIIRRLIDVTPSGRKLPPAKYFADVQKIPFELGGIAHHCYEVYQAMGKNYYAGYRPTGMIEQTDIFYNFVETNYETFKTQDYTTLSQSYEMYKNYCDDSAFQYRMTKTAFKYELKNYFKRFFPMTRVDGKQTRNVYKGFDTEKFSYIYESDPESAPPPSITIDKSESIFDEICANQPAQYATSSGTPGQKWANVTSMLRDIDTSKLHYVKLPENHIIIDFDLKDETGEKSYELNLEAASKWPPTYAEFSKSGSGIHLHYIYEGDVTKLSRVYDDNIEIKVFTGDASLRRQFTFSNGLPIAKINSGLPLKGEKPVINFHGVASERTIREQIERNLRKEVHNATRPSVDMIYKILDDAYNGGSKYDVTDMRPKILSFAANSTHQADYCIKRVNQMKFKSEEPSESLTNAEDEPMIFYDVEVFPNLFVVVWKQDGDHPCVRMINPTSQEIEELLKRKLVGFNCRRYDNHILYARYIGYTNEQLYELSQKIVSKDNRNCFFGEAYNISYTDVFDFASAANKKSLKKFEIEMGIHHQELGLPWDQPVPEELWGKVAEYCDNDVIATEATFHYLSADWTARQILAELANGSVNDTTNMLTTKILFGREKAPQSQFNYRNLGEPVHSIDDRIREFLTKASPEMMSAPHGDAKSILPYFPGYKFDNGVSTYRDEVVGEGGYVYAEPGIHYNVALLDVASMHPHSMIMECIFGVEFTTRLKEIVDGRVDIKHEAWDVVNDILDGKLTPFVQRVQAGEITAGDLANGLKTAINSIYGLTSAKFDNAFRDPRNKDNIVAKRGALFMIELKHEVQSRGFTVAHIKTDSIKIPNATTDIIKFVQDFGKRYGYTFEHEATYAKMCLVNDAVYIAKYATKEYCESYYGYVPSDIKKHGGEWTATGAQFAQPYVFKTLFSHEPIKFEDMCETKATKAGDMYLDFNERTPEDHNYVFIGKTSSFCPVVNGTDGGSLVWKKDDKYNAVTGTKGYRWMESEMVKVNKLEDKINKDYYRALVDEAIKDIGEYGDPEQFMEDEDLPVLNYPWCGDKPCEECPYYKKACDGLPF